ncbi:MAG: hypothetical protein R3A51_03745 [Nannocystaceae bacterium]
MLSGVTPGATLTGFYALDDDDAKQRARGRHELSVALREGDGPWRSLYARRVAHRPGIVTLELPTSVAADARVDLRVRVAASGEAPPRLGFDFELGER